MKDLSEQAASLICAACPDLAITILSNREDECCSAYRRGLKSCIVPYGTRFKYVIYSSQGPIIVGIEDNASAAVLRALDLMQEGA